jgi:CysZ protein
MSLQFTAYSMDRRFYTVAQRKAFQRHHRARTLGLGSMAFALMLVPVVNALFIPVAAVAGTMLFCDAAGLSDTGR